MGYKGYNYMYGSRKSRDCCYHVYNRYSAENLYVAY